ncbi:MAG: sulfurtransferase complex subunit TusD [Candidatus Aquicultor secundus]|uniref:Sulfurtransferase complex subunit TusD n=1 Tax=Candidatus Aquicultor secundus TaxID=1973895 RepID=A0A2M7T7D2_9ACTN|nr:sulfurtransferase complex subunit TusD [Candidatus Aquicultor secundus]NCO66392.1 sulfurtransferase complex subunit TusD [Solirubrobacter sp.]OIO84307.1 MAG: sulfurtransferase TusD [Candidatus Aquicultor secundus]PIW21516.1 MAG: sulfurtransferase complex subunit TusD [Candidatus Aquicultor secundus]PIX52294.1 MAG: sulfurtransferase complex subunit TusD [Candidatus Aquicultor secundus]PIY42301.1 MAG: sulfurtransferase complex subunit TusD [Candidatus Aquicultor secundus]
MKFAVLVQEGPYHHQSSDSAYQFVTAAMDKRHEIIGVFFYHDGVINSSKLADIQADDRNITKRWSEVGEKGVDLVVCIAAAKRRGINDDVLAPGFRISGLGQLTEMAIKSDRLVTFGA